MRPGSAPGAPPGAPQERVGSLSALGAHRERAGNAPGALQERGPVSRRAQDGQREPQDGPRRPPEAYKLSLINI